MGHYYSFASSVSYPKSDSIGIASTWQYAAIFETPVLNYRFLRTMPILPKLG